MPGQFVPSPKNRTPRRGGSRVSRTGREESGPLRGPRPIAARAVYKIPPRTSSAPSPIRNILASQFIAATHNRTGIQAGAIRFVPWSRHSGAEMPGGKKGRYAPPVHMIKLTETSEIAPFVWVHPDEGGGVGSRRRALSFGPTARSEYGRQKSR